MSEVGVIVEELKSLSHAKKVVHQRGGVNDNALPGKGLALLDW